MSIDLKIPAVGESISEVEIGDWLKKEGEQLSKDETVAIIETEKATVELPAPEAGVLTRILKRKGETANVGEVIGQMETESAAAEAKPTQETKEHGTTAEQAPASKTKAAEESKATESKSDSKHSQGPPTQETSGIARSANRESTPVPPAATPSARRKFAELGLRAEEVVSNEPGGRLSKQDVARHIEEKQQNQQSPKSSEHVEITSSREEQVVRMSLLRRTVARRLVEAQHSAALLTTFNEIDMSAVRILRQEYQEEFQKKHETKLGLMSFFLKAAVDALKLFPELNAEIRENDVVYRNFHDIGVAVSTDRGLVVPVLRDVDRLSFAEIEKAIADFASRARDNKLKPDEMEGGTFTITNGGVFGSLLSTPLINPPQSGVLGLHAIQDRPIAADGQIVIRPMMYVALTYDHRIVDGREAVTFLKRIKDLIETPARMLLEI